MKYLLTIAFPVAICANEEASAVQNEVHELFCLVSNVLGGSKRYRTREGGGAAAYP